MVEILNVCMGGRGQQSLARFQNKLTIHK